jgi:F0F1-type ATP synthase membrane subunit b/b'
MLRQDSSNIGPEAGFNVSVGASQNGVSAREGGRTGVDIQRELNRLEEMILDSPRFFGRTFLDEERIIEQLDQIRLSLPDAFHEADSIVRHKEEVFLQAEQYAQEIIDTADRRSNQLMNESTIVRQSEMQAQQIRQRVQQECESIREQTIAEIDRMRQQAQQELEEMQRMAIAECEAIQAGADDYADRTLLDMESQLGEMLRIVRNGRQQLQPEPPARGNFGQGGMRPAQRGK